MSVTSQVLAQCEREQLHLSGAIQPHGTLLVVEADGTIAHAAQNTQHYLGAPPEAWLGQPLPEPLATLATSLGETAGSRRWTLLRLTANSQPLQAVVTRGAHGTIVAELVPQEPGEDLGRPSASRRAPTPRTSEEMAADEHAITERIAELTDFPRVMYYRFREDGDGEVIAETRRGESYGSYLGLRFPASDIPQVARQLYLKNPWRMIPAAAAVPVPVLGKTPNPPDLTYSDLRSVSPVHQVYLANMGVVASLSFPVVKRAELIGLIAAHHSRVQSLPFAVLDQCGALVSRHAQTALNYDLQQTLRRQDSITQSVERLRPFVGTLSDIEQNWDAVGDQLLAMFRADGVRLWSDGLQLERGLSASEADRSPLDDWFSHSEGKGVKYSDNIRRFVAQSLSGNIAGALCIDGASRAGDLRLYLTRREHIHEVAWGGNPDKPMEAIVGPLPIAPRRSFEKWVEKRFGYCRPWNAEERHLALALRVLLLQELRP
ncbi:MAG TPA: GAF domain-containing protein [Polyangiales bacterium]|nr:GAF domain-containing protein [Polyangiales bacterium]